MSFFNNTAQKTIIILTSILLKYREMYLLNNGFGLTNMSAGVTDGVEFSEGYQLGGNTEHRTGDSFSIKDDNGTVTYKYKLGYSILLFAFGKINIYGEAISGYFRVRDNSFRFDYTKHISNNTACKVTVDAYEFTKFGDVNYETSEPLSNDGLLPSDMKEVLLNHINAKLQEKKPSLEAELQRMCEPKRGLSVVHPGIN